MQRSNILTWSLEDKRRLFRSNRVGLVVNFWSKLDPDMSECHDVSYLYMPKTDAGESMLGADIDPLADFVVAWLQRYPDRSVLVLCEAGRGRSVYFSCVLYAKYTGCSTADAMAHVVRTLGGRHSMKPFLMAHLTDGGASLL